VSESDESLERLTPEEIAAESGTALPVKEVLSLLDLNANVDLLLDLAAPVDLAIGANANIAAPVNAAVDANLLSPGSLAQAETVQAGAVHQGIVGNATAVSDQTSSIAQGGQTAPGATDTGTAVPGASDPGTAVPAASDTGTAVPAAADPGATAPAAADSGATAPAAPDPGATAPDSGTTVSTGSLLNGNLLNVNVDVNGNLHLASPIDGAVAANANAAVPINAAVSANVGSTDSSSTALSEQQVSIDQSIQGDATAIGQQDSGISQGTTPATGTGQSG
jgi:hypothetical protein